MCVRVCARARARACMCVRARARPCVCVWARACVSWPQGPRVRVCSSRGCQGYDGEGAGGGETNKPHDGEEQAAEDDERQARPQLLHHQPPLVARRRRKADAVGEEEGFHRRPDDWLAGLGVQPPGRLAAGHKGASMP